MAQLFCYEKVTGYRYWFFRVGFYEGAGRPLCGGFERGVEV